MKMKLYMIKGGDKVNLNGKVFTCFDGAVRQIAGYWSIKVIDEARGIVRCVGSFRTLDETVELCN